MNIFRSLTISTPLAGALAFASPAFAQEDASSQDEQVMAEMMAMFAVEPLSAEEEGRLPLAREVVDKMIPPGSLGEVMGDMFDGFLGPIMQKASEPKASDFAANLGLEAWELDMDDAAVGEAIAIIDPLHQERAARTAAVMPEVMTNMMNVMEPTMRKAMSEAFAASFGVTELTDINAFFATDSGAAFAKKSMTMSSDPRIIGATMEALPEMMASMQNMEADMKAATADMPQPRNFTDLSEQEQARIAELTGYTVEELTMRAAEAQAEGEAEQ